MRGSGFDKVDLRIHAIDPLSRDFWPFPADGVETDDATEPPLPGNAPGKWSDDKNVDAAAITARINALGSPAVSELVTLPIQRGGAGAKFGLDLKPYSAAVRASRSRTRPAHFSSACVRSPAANAPWMRVQVTDLTLTAVEEDNRVRFFVTSLSNATPVEGAAIRLEGLRDDKFVTLVEGRTDGEGAFTWDVGKRAEAEIKRIVVGKGLDALVLEPGNGPAEYARENWTRPEEAWLAWTVNPGVTRATPPPGAAPRLLRAADLPARRARANQGLRAQLSGRRALAYAKGGGTLVVTDPGSQGMAPAGRRSTRPATSIRGSTRRRLRQAIISSNSSRTRRPKPRATKPMRTMTTRTPMPMHRIRVRHPAATFRSRRKPIACRPSRFCSTRRRRSRSKANSPSIF